MKVNIDKCLSGARKILSECLSLSKDDDILIFCDETTTETVELMATAAKSLCIEYVLIFEPQKLQSSHIPEEEFSWPIKSLLDQTCSVLTCLGDSQACLPYRKKVIKNSKGGPRRTGHMPGANLLSLMASDADYDQMRRDCGNLAIALTKGSNIRIITKDENGENHYLDADLGGWDRTAIPSDGKIPRGAWGNIPGGETYIAPMEGTGSGSIVINVAFPGFPIKRKNTSVVAIPDEAILYFDKGKLVKFVSKTKKISQIFEREKKYAKSYQDLNWSNLAEIGIGVNRSINYPTGIPLIDEKLFGTTHIAIGDNIHHGGNSDSVIHCDLVTSADVLVDGKQILRDEEICFDNNEWCENYRQVNLRNLFDNNPNIRLTGCDCVKKQNILYKCASTRAGRLIEVQVGDLETASIALKIFDQIPIDRQYISADDLFNKLSIPRENFFRVLQLLYDYFIIEISE